MMRLVGTAHHNGVSLPNEGPESADRRVLAGFLQLPGHAKVDARESLLATQLGDASDDFGLQIADVCCNDGFVANHHKSLSVEARGPRACR